MTILAPIAFLGLLLAIPILLLYMLRLRRREMARAAQSSQRGVMLKASRGLVPLSLSLFPFHWS